ncbi:MAG TPA: CHAT domain-containing tetratricopeptide repeat protein [Kofleriaceae bacterium]|nr:CHAT domain-containing tetratricopeptide repeat protein [Kofleriaceae bacterium]
MRELMRRGRAVLALCAVLGLLGDAGAQPRGLDRDNQLAEARGQQMMAERALSIGEYQRGLPFAESALSVREALLDKDDPLIAESALVVGVMRAHNGDRRQAEPLLARALAIRERALPASDPAIAAALVAYAALLRDVGAYARAESMLVRAVAIEERASKPPGPGLARALEELALVLAEKDDPRSEPMLRRAIAILEASAGADGVEVARPLGELAGLLSRRGDDAGAEPLYLRALAILESTGDLGDPRRAAALLDVAGLRLAAGHADEAMTLGGLAYTVDVAILGAEHPFVARDLMRLAELARAGGDAPRAERYVWRALAIRERTLGGAHPAVADALAELAASYEARADLGNAIKLLRRALAIYKGALGAKHPSVARTLMSLARVTAAQKDLPGALALATEAGEIREDSLQLLLDAGSERQKRLYLATLDDETNATIALHAQLAPGDAAALRLAVLTVLRRKGRVLDTMVDTFATLRGRVAPADVALIEQLAAARSRLAELVLQGPAPGTSAEQHASDVTALTDEAQRLEADIGTRAGVRPERPRVTLAAVQAAIPRGRVLVELASYQPVVLDGGGAPQERRYIAYVVAPTGEPRWVDLGPQRPIDALVRQVRAAFADSARGDATDLARQLDALVMQPIRPLLGADDAIVLSPEGALNLVPFGALVDEDRRFLVERRMITYVTTGRDLLRMAADRAHASDDGIVVMADPAFGEAAPTAPDGASDQRRSSELAGVVFPPLPGTREEGEALAARLEQPTVRLGEDASEAAIKSVRAPMLLHVATHGFFLDDMPGGPLGTRALVRVAGDGTTATPPPTSTVIENPLLRSGLAFAGVNRGGAAGAKGKDDGVLTALEAASLDLWGTQLVVLSACETGVGLVRNGDGVYGLRRALVMAGSHSQVISLWKVDDLATRDLMIGYYERITAGDGRGDALRAAQLAMLASPDRRHPYFWASFIPSGDWGPMHTAAGRGLQPVARGARGCGCGAGSERTDGAGATLLVVLVAAATMRRRFALGATLATTIVLVGATTVARADTTVTLPASQLEVQVPGAPGTWSVSDASSGGRRWDMFRRSGPDLAIRAQATNGPTSCFLTLTLRHLASMSGARVVTRPGYLPPEFFPDTLELASAGGATALVCVDLPDGAATMILHYSGASWARDAAEATPVLRAFAAAAAWGPGRVTSAARDVKLPLTGLSLRLPAGWAENHAPTFDIVERRHAGKPLVRIGLRTDIVRPMTVVRGKLVAKAYPKGAGDSCAFWAEGLRIAPTPDVHVVDRPAFVPRAWHAQAAFTAEPRHDRVTVCLDTTAGRWLATVEVLGAITDPGLADVTGILQHIAAHP